MKLVFFCLLLVGIYANLHLQIDSSIQLPLNYDSVYIPLRYSGNQGQVSINVKGLPDGFYFSRNAIKGKTGNKQGYFPLLIDLRDEQGNELSKICIIKISKKYNQDTSSSTSASTSFNTDFETDQLVSQNLRDSFNGQFTTATVSSNSQISRNSVSTNNFISNLSSNRNLAIQTISSSNLRSGSISTPISPRKDLDSLLDQLAPINTQSILNSKPPPVFPIFNLPPPNVRPSIIKTSQAPRSDANRNKITEDDIKTTAIFERQLNANKAIANLLDIVDQLRANIKAATDDMVIFESQVQNTINFQRNTQAKITAAENKVSRLKQAISNMNGKIDLLRQQLSELQNSFKSTTTNISSQQSSINSLNRDINKYEDKLDSLTTLIADTNKAIQTVEQEIVGIIRETQDIKIKLQKKKQEISNIDALIDDTVRNVLNIDEEINDLKMKLNSAITRKVKTEREELRLRNLKANAPTQIAKLQDQIRLKERDVEDLQKEKGKFLDELKRYTEEADSATNKLDSVRLKMNQIKTQIAVVQGNKEDFDKAIQNKNKEIEQALQTLQFLQQELAPYEQALGAAYNQGEQANVALSTAQQNLVAISIRWQQDNAKLQTALKNLQKARAQKELADLAMEQLLQQRSDVLPYSVVSNENGSNNPGFSFGSTITSTRSRSSSNIQYPISLYRRQTNPINNMAPYLGPTGTIVPEFYQGGHRIVFSGSFRCSSNPSNKFEGTIREVGDNAIKILSQNGEMLVGAISSCTLSYGPKPNYQLSIGDKVSFYGQNIKEGIININSINCGL